MDPLDCSLDLLRRLPPSKITQNVAKIIQLKPDLAEDLLSAVDQPLQISFCSKTGVEFLLCDYNRDGSTYRYDFMGILWHGLTIGFSIWIEILIDSSPFSGEYQDASGQIVTGGYKPSAQLAGLEKAFNDAFSTYRDLYFGGGASSVYLWDLDQGFAGAILIKKGLSISRLQ